MPHGVHRDRQSMLAVPFCQAPRAADPPRAGPASVSSLRRAADHSLARGARVSMLPACSLFPRKRRPRSRRPLRPGWGIRRGRALRRRFPGIADNAHARNLRPSHRRLAATGVAVATTGAAGGQSARQIGVAPSAPPCLGAGAVEVVGGRRIRCPDCGGKDTVLEPDHPYAPNRWG